MRVYHITSPAKAVNIVKQGVFYPASDHPLNNDNGLNCFGYRAGYTLGQCFEGTGAKLILEWSGPVAITHLNTSPPLPSDVLHDQYPWRCFIRGGSTPEFLRIVDIHFEKGAIDSLLDFPGWHCYLPTQIARSLQRLQKLRFLKAIRTTYRSKALSLRVVG